MGNSNSSDKTALPTSTSETNLPISCCRPGTCYIYLGLEGSAGHKSWYNQYCAGSSETSSSSARNNSFFSTYSGNSSSTPQPYFSTPSFTNPYELRGKTRSIDDLIRDHKINSQSLMAPIVESAIDKQKIQTRGSIIENIIREKELKQKKLELAPKPLIDIWHQHEIVMRRSVTIPDKIYENKRYLIMQVSDCLINLIAVEKGYIITEPELLHDIITEKLSKFESKYELEEWIKDSFFHYALSVPADELISLVNIVEKQIVPPKSSIICDGVALTAVSLATISKCMYDDYQKSNTITKADLSNSSECYQQEMIPESQNIQSKEASSSSNNALPPLVPTIWRVLIRRSSS